MLVDTTLLAFLPLEYYPEAQTGDEIKLTESDIEFIQSSMADEQSLSKYDDLYLVVEHIVDEVIIGSLCQEVDIAIKMGLINPSDYKVVSVR